MVNWLYPNKLYLIHIAENPVLLYPDFPSECSFIEEVENIEPSRYTLPRFVRQAARGIERSYLLVKDANGDFHRINPGDDFTPYELAKPITMPLKCDSNYYYSNSIIKIKKVLADSWE